MRALDANAERARHGVLTSRPTTLTNDFFVNLLAPGTEWKASSSAENVYEARPSPANSSGPRPPSTLCSVRTLSCERSRRSTRVTTRKEKFVRDFVAAWDKVMNLDPVRSPDSFDLA